jgi:hypothetical protein
MEAAGYPYLANPRSPAAQASVTLAATNKALYPASALPSFAGPYFGIPGKRFNIKGWGLSTTAATPGNYTFSMLWGTGADANGVSMSASAATAMIASQTNAPFMFDIDVECVTAGATGTLWTAGIVKFIESGLAAMIILPPTVSAAVDLTSTLVPSLQLLRSGSTAETATIQRLFYTAY